jgi:hypothetical protein
MAHIFNRLRRIIMDNNNTKKLEPGTVVTGTFKNGVATPTPSDKPQPKSVIIDGMDGIIWATPKVFSTGSVGFYATGKLTDLITHKKYQVGVNIIEIGSKPGSKQA